MSSAVFSILNLMPAKADANCVGEYKPGYFGFGKFTPGVKPSDFEKP